MTSAIRTDRAFEEQRQAGHDLQWRLSPMLRMKTVSLDMYFDTNRVKRAADTVTPTGPKGPPPPSSGRGP